MKLSDIKRCDCGQILTAAAVRNGHDQCFECWSEVECELAGDMIDDQQRYGS